MSLLDPNVQLSGDIQSTLNEDQSKLVHLVTQLRYWITKQRVQKTLYQLPATPYEKLPILFDQVNGLYLRSGLKLDWN